MINESSIIVVIRIDINDAARQLIQIGIVFMAGPDVAAQARRFRVSRHRRQCLESFVTIRADVSLVSVRRGSQMCNEPPGLFETFPSGILARSVLGNHHEPVYKPTCSPFAGK